MASESIEPNSTDLNEGTIQGGAATAHAALSDDDNATYITLDGDIVESGIDHVKVGFQDPTIPAGSVVKQVIVFATLAKVTNAPAAKVTVSSGGDSYEQVIVITSSAAQQFIPINWVKTVDPDSLTVDVAALGLDLNVYELDVLVVWGEPATVTVDGPTGTIDEDSTPPVEWTNELDPHAGDVTATQIKIFTEAQFSPPGFDPDTTTPFDEVALGTESETTWAPTIAQGDGNHRAYVRVIQGVNQGFVVSDWAYTEYEMDVPSPGEPTLLLEAQPDEGQVKYTLSENVGVATTDGFEVQRQTADGWIDVRTPPGGLTETSVAGWDLEAPNADNTYRARAFHTNAGGSGLSEWVEESVLLDGDCWLKHPFDPTLNHRATLRSFPGHNRVARQSTPQPLGADFPVPIFDTRGSQTGEVVFSLEDDADRDEVAALASAGVPLLLQFAWGDHEPDRWVNLGDEGIVREADLSFIEERTAAYPWTEVARPEGDSAAWPLLYPSEDLYPAEDLFMIGGPS